MNVPKPIIAIIYDFDKTLTDQDMQNYSFIPALGMTPPEFWEETGKFSQDTGVERILSYMFMMIVKAKEKGIVLTRDYLFRSAKKLNTLKVSKLGLNALISMAKKKASKLNITSSAVERKKLLTAQK